MSSGRSLKGNDDDLIDFDVYFNKCDQNNKNLKATAQRWFHHIKNKYDKYIKPVCKYTKDCD